MALSELKLLRPQSTDTSARASCGVSIYIPAASITCKLQRQQGVINLHNAAAFLLADKLAAMSMQVRQLPLHHNAINWVLHGLVCIIDICEDYEELK